jgi:hypothetical protein
MTKLLENVTDPALFELLIKYLKAGAITVEGKFINTPQGVPQGRLRAIRLNLIKPGTPRDKVKLASRSRKGHWRLTNIEIVRNAMQNAWLAKKIKPGMW